MEVQRQRGLSQGGKDKEEQRVDEAASELSAAESSAKWAVAQQRHEEELRLAEQKLSSAESGAQEQSRADEQKREEEQMQRAREQSNAVQMTREQQQSNAVQMTREQQQSNAVQMTREQQSNAVQMTREQQSNAVQMTREQQQSNAVQMTRDKNGGVFRQQLYPALQVTAAVASLDADGLVAVQLPFVAEDAFASSGIVMSAEDPLLLLVRRYRELVYAYFDSLQQQDAMSKTLATLEKDCWSFETRIVRETRQCGHSVPFTEDHEFSIARCEGTAQLKTALELQKEDRFKRVTLQNFDMEVAYEDVRMYLCTYFAESGLIRMNLSSVIAERERDLSLGPVAAMLRHFVEVFLGQTTDDPRWTNLASAGTRHFRASIAKWLEMSVAPLQRIASCADHLFLLRALLSTPESGWASFCIQLPRQLQTGDHLTLVLQLLQELMTSPYVDSEFGSASAAGSDEEFDDWVHVKQSIPPVALRQGQDDLEKMFAQIPLSEAIELACDDVSPTMRAYAFSRGLFSTLALQAAVHTIKVLVMGAARYARFSHLGRVLGHAVVRVLKQMATKDGVPPQQVDSLCVFAVAALLRLPCHMWSFLRDVPYEACSGTAVRKMALLLFTVDLPAERSVALTKADDFNTTACALSEPFGRAIGKWSVGEFSEEDANQKVTHILYALANIAVTHADGALCEGILRFIVRVGFYVAESSAISYKVARACLGNICTEKPWCVSLVLSAFGDLGLWAGALFVMRDLPLPLWLPGSEDLAFIRRCLLSDANGKENSCGRAILNGMDFGYAAEGAPDGGSGLVLGPEIHRSCALLAVEAMAHHAKKSPSEGVKSLNRFLWQLAERTIHADVYGNLLLPAMDLQLPMAAVIREQLAAPLDPPSQSSALAAFVALSIVDLQSLNASVPDLLKRLVDAGAQSDVDVAKHGFAYAFANVVPMLARRSFRREPPFTLIEGLSNVLKQGVLSSRDSAEICATLASQQVALAASSAGAEESGEAVACFWVQQLSSIQGWPRRPELRLILERVFRAAFLFSVPETALRVLSETSPMSTLDLPVLAESMWAIPNIPAMLFTSAAVAEKYERMSQWGAAHPWLTLALLVAETRRQVPSWRALGVLADSTESPAALSELCKGKAPTDFCVFQWARLCERLAPQTEPFLVFWQLFFMLFFERSPLGKCFAVNLLTAHDPMILSRLAGCLERASAAEPQGEVYNAMALWMRFEGAPAVLTNNWAGLPPQYKGEQLLRRFAIGMNVADSFSGGAVLWDDLLTMRPAAKRQLLDAATHSRNGDGKSGANGAGRRMSASVYGASSSMMMSSMQQPYGGGPRSSAPVIPMQSFAPETAVAPPRLELQPLGGGSLDMQVEESWLSTVAGLRGSIVAELDAIEHVAREWSNGLALVTALHHELLEAIPGRYVNVEDVHVVSRYCKMGVDCMKPAQFAFRGTKIVSITRVEERISQIHKLLHGAFPNPANVQQAVSTAVALSRQMRQLASKRKPAQANEIEIVRLGKEVFFRLVDTSVDMPFPPLVRIAGTLCDELARAFVEGNTDSPLEILNLIVERSERAGLLLAHLHPEDAKSADEYIALLTKVCRAPESARVGLQWALLQRFSVAEWCRKYNPSLDSAKRFCELLLANLRTPTASELSVAKALKMMLSALHAQFFPRLSLFLLERMINICSGASPATQLWHEALSVFFDDNERRCRHIRDSSIVTAMATALKDFLWKRRGLANPPRSKSLFDALPVDHVVVLARFIQELTLSDAFQEPRADEAYGMLRKAEPERAWTVFTDLVSPFVRTLGVNGLSNPKPRADNVSFPPWPGTCSAATDVVHSLIMPTLSALARTFPSEIMTQCWAFVCDVLPYSPLHVQSSLVDGFEQLPWEELRSTDVAFCRSIRAAQCTAGFPSAALTHVLCSVVVKLPVYNGMTEIGIESMAEAWLSVAELAVALPASDASFSGDAGKGGVLGPLLSRGVPWKRQLASVEGFNVLMANAFEFCRLTCQADFGMQDRKVQMGAVLRLLEDVGAVDGDFDSLFLQYLTHNFLPCGVIPREMLHPFVARAMHRSLDLASAGFEQNAHMCFRLYNFPEYSYSPGIEAALDSALNTRPANALIALKLACSTIASAEKMPSAAERCLEAHFLLTNDWPVAGAVLAVPELEPEQFLDAAQREQCVLVLAAYCSQRAVRVGLLRQWALQLQVTPPMAWKAPLLWALYCVAAPDEAAVQELMKHLENMGRDMVSQSIVAFLGFGERSPFSLEFRLCCRFMRCFILASLPSTNIADVKKELKAVVASAGNIPAAKFDAVVQYIERKNPRAKCLELMKLLGPELFPNHRVWDWPIQ